MPCVGRARPEDPASADRRRRHPGPGGSPRTGAIGAEPPWHPSVGVGDDGVTDHDVSDDGHDAPPASAGDRPAGPVVTDTDADDHGLSRWVALFYDLIFVAAILIFSRAVEHIHPQTGAFWIVAVFVAAWWIWYSTTVLAHRLQLADLAHRMLLLAQMLVIVLMAMEARVSVDGDSGMLGFEYAVLLLTVAVMYLRAWRGTGPGADAAGRLAVVNLGAALCVLVGVTVAEPGRLAVYLVGLGISVLGTAVVWHGGTALRVADERHYIDRMAAFTLIVCGEAFIESALAVSGATIASIDVTSLTFEFVLVFALFSSYFETVPPSGIDPRRFRPWSALHLVVQLAVAASAVSVTKLIGLHEGSRVPDAEILRLTVPLVAFYAAMAGLDACTRRRPAHPMARLHLATAGVMGAVGLLAWYVPPVHLVEALPMLDAVAVGYLVAAVRVRRRTRVLAPAELVAAS